MKKKFEHHTFLKQELADGSLKLFYFRNIGDEDYEVEEYIYKDKHVKDLKFGASTKKYYDDLLAQPNVSGAAISSYFGNKGTEWTAFGEPVDGGIIKP